MKRFSNSYIIAAIINLYIHFISPNRASEKHRHIHCESKKLGHFYFYCNFVKYWPILIILSLFEPQIHIYHIYTDTQKYTNIYVHTQTNNIYTHTTVYMEAVELHDMADTLFHSLYKYKPKIVPWAENISIHFTTQIRRGPVCQYITALVICNSFPV